MAGDRTRRPAGPPVRRLRMAPAQLDRPSAFTAAGTESPPCTRPFTVACRSSASVTRRGGRWILAAAMVKTSSLAGFAVAFMAGYGLGFMHHHIAHVATEHNGDSLDGSTRLRSVEARLAQLEARAAMVPAATHSHAAYAVLPASDDTTSIDAAASDHALAVSLSSKKSKHHKPHKRSASTNRTRTTSSKRRSKPSAARSAGAARRSRRPRRT